MRRWIFDIRGARVPEIQTGSAGRRVGVSAYAIADRRLFGIMLGMLDGSGFGWIPRSDCRRGEIHQLPPPAMGSVCVRWISHFEQRIQSTFGG